MLDPSGDAKHTGRIIGETFERGVTLQFTEELKTILEKRNKNIRVILTRFPGETLEPLQNASFANRLDTDYFVSIMFYQEKKERAELSMYHFMSQPTDIWQKNLNPLNFYPYDKAHLIQISKSKSFGEEIEKIFKSKNFRTIFNYNGFFGIPAKPLIGVKAPSIAIEVGLMQKDDWKKFLGPFVFALESVLGNTK